MNSMDPIALSWEGDVVRLVLQRPPLNLLNLELLHRFEEHLENLARDNQARALIIDTEVPVFCAGLEPSELTRERVFLLLEQFHRTARQLCNHPRPTIALVRGMALGAGNELTACCDFVLASEKASFGQPEIKIGGIPSLAPMLLPSLVGQRRALDLILTGKFIGAKEAERLGLINRVLPEDQLLKAAEELVSTFRSLSNAVIQVALQSVRMSRIREWDRHVREAESLYLNDLMELDDAVEGVQAFVEKRPPRWKNL
jgi:cyclohexa-1,5-dienecarbonyl-CoA hydratase